MMLALIAVALFVRSSVQYFFFLLLIANSSLTFWM
jgi:hypothetical protein